MNVLLTQRVAALTTIATLVIAACGGTDDESSDEPPTTRAADVRPATVVAVSTSPAAGSVAEPTSTTEQSTIVAATTAVSCDGTNGSIPTPSGRSVVLRASGITGPAPTIVVMHGFTGTPAGIERVADLTDVSNRLQIAVAYPEGTSVSLGGFGWNSGAEVFATTGVDDQQALVDMIDVIVATGCVDRDRITIAGESNGAGMTLAALCSPALRGEFRSAVMVIPAIDDGVLERCTGHGAADTPLAVAIGLIDTTAPVDGGNGLLPQRAWFEQVAAWRGCSGVTPWSPLTPSTELSSGTDCGACTEMFAVADNPHTWPGTTEGNGGSTPGTFDLNRRIIADALAATPDCLSQR